MDGVVLKQISKYYGNKLALNNLSFNVKKGEIFGLLGHNGAGKTTTLRIISGIIDNYNGEVLINGNIGYLPEERGLYKDEKVKDILKFFGELHDIPTSKLKEQIDYYLNKLNVSQYKNSKIKTLSKGNQQKIQFIVSIIHNPDIIILDEPFTGLDIVNLNLIKDIIYGLKEQGKTIILSTHQLEKIERFCDRILILKEGKAVKYGRLDEICKKTAYIEYLEDNKLIKYNLSHGEALQLLNDENIKNNIVKFEVRSSLEELFMEDNNG
ncbi:ABC transporter ATP-binding protein [Methanococcus aeolicus]|uniref:ABC transporter related protein n=2 Tax=Methanococcus aeolicus TaxID=42879 RepID=A6UX05_META3|nr:ATP-binding cassette domain-containing protein [Methanococcus aeolicus]ABR57027.1 ABC transporter related protein [Methanococcus aeolicus Nankai-3]UXM85024.1 ATP-binding cassette domain-containing protein [Methanococcus aeolicus]